MLDADTSPPTRSLAVSNKRRRVDGTETGNLLDDKRLNRPPSKLVELGLDADFACVPHNEQAATAMHDAKYSDDSVRVDIENIHIESDSGDFWNGRRESIYVTAFNTAVDTVVDRESHLFNEDEMNIIRLYKDLPCIDSQTVRSDGAIR